jgi:hypothetical protein
MKHLEGALFSFTQAKEESNAAKEALRKGNKCVNPIFRVNCDSLSRILLVFKPI